jgi:acyl dehydratase
MSQTLAALEKGHAFPATPFTLTEDWVRDYIEAVDDNAIATGSVPPMALAALSIRALLEHSGLPPGAIHLAQELSFRRAVAIGEILAASADVTSRGERQGWVLMGVSLKVTDEGGEAVMDGRATISFPLAGAQS